MVRAERELKTPSVAILDHSLHQVAQLSRGKLVALKIRRQLSLPVNDNGMQRVCHKAFVRPRVHAKPGTHLLHVRDWPREEVPGSRIRVPSLGRGGQNFRLVVRRVETHSEQNQVSPHVGCEALLQKREIIGEAVAELRQGTPCVDKVDGHNLARELAE